MLTFYVTYSYLVQSMQSFLFINNAISFNIFYHSNMSSCRFRCCHGPWHTGTQGETRRLRGHWQHWICRLGGSLVVVRSYAPGCEPLVTGNLAMGLTIRSSHKQELSFSLPVYWCTVQSMYIWSSPALKPKLFSGSLSGALFSECSSLFGALRTVLVQGYIY